jgi:DNA replication protein DnaC
VGATALGGQAVGASGRELKRLWRIPLVVIEVGYVPFDPEAVALFFELVSSRYDRPR